MLKSLQMNRCFLGSLADTIGCRSSGRVRGKNMSKMQSIIRIMFTGLIFMCFYARPNNISHVAADSLLYEIRDAIPDGLESLQQYNRENVKQIDINRITRFLNEEIKSLGLNPASFHYFVGDDWKVIQRPKGIYGLVIPHGRSSDVDFFMGLGKRAFGYNVPKYEPEHRFNIVDLDANLKNGMADIKGPLYHQYRLEIRKAIIQAVENRIAPKVLDSMVRTGIVAGKAALEKIVETLSMQTNIAISALNALYGYTAGKQDWLRLQQAIDSDVLRSHDIDLIKARITEIERQVQEEKGSFIGKMMHLFSGNKKRLAILQDYLKDNDLELRMYKQFMQKMSTARQS